MTQNVNTSINCENMKKKEENVKNWGYFLTKGRSDTIFGGWKIKKSMTRPGKTRAFL